MSGDAAWLEWRRNGITATDVAKATANIYGGAYGVVADKLGLLPKVEQNAAMERGHRWQPVVADAVHLLTGLFVVGEETWCESSDPRWRCTVDGFLAEQPEVAGLDDVTGVVEIKTVGVSTKHATTYYETQVQWQLLVTGQQSALLAIATIDDSDDTCTDLQLQRIQADTLTQAALVGTAEQLWEHVQTGTLPEPLAESLETVKAVYRKANIAGKAVPLDDWETELTLLDDYKRTIRETELAVANIEARLRNHLGENTLGVSDSWTVKIGAPSQVLDDAAQSELLRKFPQLGTIKLDRIKAKKLLGADYGGRTEATGPRRLTIKHHTGDTNYE